MLVSTSRPRVSGRFVSFEKYWMYTGCESSCSVKSFFERSGRILPCLSRTVASTLTTFMLTETVGVFGSVDAAGDSLPAVEVLFEGVDVCCANKVPLRQSPNRTDLATREIVFEGKEAGGMKIMTNTMPQWRRVHSKGL